MARSRRKVPIIGNSSGSEKQDKREANRALRRLIRANLDEETEDFPHVREVSDVWAFNKDGKRYNADLDDRHMRK